MSKDKPPQLELKGSQRAYRAGGVLFENNLEMVLVLNWFYASVAATFMVLRLVLFKSFSINVFNLFALATYFGASALYVKKSRNLKLGGILLSSIFFVGIPLRIVLTGGLTSPIIILYLSHCAIVLNLYGNKAGIAVFTWSILSIFMIAWLQKFIGLSGGAFYESPINFAITHVIFLAALALAALYLVRGKDAILGRLRKLERARISYLFMKELSDETGDTVEKALSGLRTLKADRNLADIDKIEAPLNELASALKRIGHTVEGQVGAQEEE